MGNEQTLILVKPDAVQRGLVGNIISRLEKRGLKIVSMKMLHMNESLAKKHYSIHEGKPFFNSLVDYITSAPIVAAVLEGTNAVEITRQTMGATDPINATPGTIRGDLALEIGRNLVHGSDTVENAKIEIATFFSAGAIVSYDRSIDGWLMES